MESGGPAEPLRARMEPSVVSVRNSLKLLEEQVSLCYVPVLSCPVHLLYDHSKPLMIPRWMDLSDYDFRPGCTSTHTMHDTRLSLWSLPAAILCLISHSHVHTISQCIQHFRIKICWVKIFYSWIINFVIKDCSNSHLESKHLEFFIISTTTRNLLPKSRMNSQSQPYSAWIKKN